MNIDLNIDPQNPNVTAHALNELLNLHRTGIHPPRPQPEPVQPEKHHQGMGRMFRKLKTVRRWMK